MLLSGEKQLLYGRFILRVGNGNEERQLGSKSIALPPELCTIRYVPEMIQFVCLTLLQILWII